MFFDGATGAHFLDSVGERLASRPQKRLGARAHFAHGVACAGVRPIAVELRRNVDIDEIAGRQRTFGRDAVRELIIDADARRAGKAVGELGRRARAVLREHAPSDRVELRGRDPWPHCAPHRVARLRHDLADAQQRVDVFRSRDRHSPSLRWLRERRFQKLCWTPTQLLPPTNVVRGKAADEVSRVACTMMSVIPPRKSAPPGISV